MDSHTLFRVEGSGGISTKIPLEAISALVKQLPVHILNRLEGGEWVFAKMVKHRSDQVELEIDGQKYRVINPSRAVPPENREWLLRLLPTKDSTKATEAAKATETALRPPPNPSTHTISSGQLPVQSFSQFPTQYSPPSDRPAGAVRDVVLQLLTVRQAAILGNVAKNLPQPAVNSGTPSGKFSADSSGVTAASTRISATKPVASSSTVVNGPLVDSSSINGLLVRAELVSNTRLSASIAQHIRQSFPATVAPAFQKTSAAVGVAPVGVTPGSSSPAFPHPSGVSTAQPSSTQPVPPVLSPPSSPPPFPSSSFAPSSSVVQQSALSQSRLDTDQKSVFSFHRRMAAPQAILSQTAQPSSGPTVQSPNIPVINIPTSSASTLPNVAQATDQFSPLITPLANTVTSSASPQSPRALAIPLKLTSGSTIPHSRVLYATNVSAQWSSIAPSFASISHQTAPAPAFSAIAVNSAPVSPFSPTLTSPAPASASTIFPASSSTLYTGLLTIIPKLFPPSTTSPATNPAQPQQTIQPTTVSLPLLSHAVSGQPSTGQNPGNIAQANGGTIPDLIAANTGAALPQTGVTRTSAVPFALSSVKLYGTSTELPPKISSGHVGQQTAVVINNIITKKANNYPASSGHTTIANVATAPVVRAGGTLKHPISQYQRQQKNTQMLQSHAQAPVSSRSISPGQSLSVRLYSPLHLPGSLAGHAILGKTQGIDTQGRTLISSERGQFAVHLPRPVAADIPIALVEQELALPTIGRHRFVSLENLMAALPVETAKAVHQVMPKANTTIATGLLFFLLNLRLGNGLQGWLGQNTFQQLTRSVSRATLLSAEEEIRAARPAPATADGSGVWQNMVMPLQLQGEVIKLTLYWRERQKNKQNKERNIFAIEGYHHQMGRFRLDGQFSSKRLTLHLASDRLLPSEMEDTLHEIFSGQLERYQLVGNIQFLTLGDRALWMDTDVQTLDQRGIAL